MNAGISRASVRQRYGRRSRRLMERLRDAYWPIPALCVVIAAASAYGLVRLDHGLQREGIALAFTGGPDSARSLLSTIAGSTLTLTALVFSITIVVLQLASSQFSPRALPTFLRDRQSQVTLGAFLATFVFSLVTLREIRGQDGLSERFIPGITISVAFGLVTVSVALFVLFIHHIAQSIRVVNNLERIGHETRTTIGRLHAREQAIRPEEEAANGELPIELFTLPGRLVRARHHGVVASVDTHHLVELASQRDGLVEVVPQIGAFVVTGSPPAHVGSLCRRRRVAQRRRPRCRAQHAPGRRLRIPPTRGHRRTGAVTGVNDPSTAVACLDQLHDLQRRLVDRPDPSPFHRDDDGRVRAVVPVQRWEDFLALSVDEIGH